MVAGQLTETILQGYVNGLRCLHKLGYVHGDVEPRHLCITTGGLPAVTDLGEARALDVQGNSPKSAWMCRGIVLFI